MYNAPQFTPRPGQVLLADPRIMFKSHSHSVVSDLSENS